MNDESELNIMFIFVYAHKGAEEEERMKSGSKRHVTLCA